MRTSCSPTIADVEMATTEDAQDMDFKVKNIILHCMRIKSQYLLQNPSKYEVIEPCSPIMANKGLTGSEVMHNKDVKVVITIFLHQCMG